MEEFESADKYFNKLFESRDRTMSYQHVSNALLRAGKVDRVLDLG